MPTPIKPVSIAVKVTNGNEGEWIKVTNFTSGGTIRAQLNSKSEAVVNSAESNLTWKVDDIIQVEVHGSLNETKRAVLATTSSSRKFTLSGSADANTPGISM